MSQQWPFGWKKPRMNNNRALAKTATAATAFRHPGHPGHRNPALEEVPGGLVEHKEQPQDSTNGVDSNLIDSRTVPNDRTRSGVSHRSSELPSERHTKRVAKGLKGSERPEPQATDRHRHHRSKTASHLVDPPVPKRERTHNLVTS